MNFDVRSYCEMLAKAAPERFEFIEFRKADVYGRDWLLINRTSHYSTRGNTTPQELWAFIGPLADELGLTWGHYLANSDMTLLEATFAACCKKLEAAKP